MIVSEIGRSVLVSKSEQFRFQQAVARTPHKPQVDNAKTATLEAGRYLDALQVTIGDVVSPLLLGNFGDGAGGRARLFRPLLRL